MEIAPNIHWLEAGGNVYLIIDTPNIVLIDTGNPRQQNTILNYLKQLNYQPTDLTHILVTHADIDHVGSLAALYEASGAQLLAGAASAQLINVGKSPKHMPIFVQWLIDTFIRFSAVPQDKISVFEDGDMLPFLDGLQVMATPGHTLDHFSFYSSTMGILFAGDALDTRNGRINLTRSTITADKTAARRSAIRLLELSPAVIATGHGPPSSKHSSDEIMQLFNTLRQE